MIYKPARHPTPAPTNRRHDSRDADAIDVGVLVQPRCNALGESAGTAGIEHIPPTEVLARGY